MENVNETTRAIEQISLSIHNQNEAIERLNEMVQKFKV